jgi:antitoxin VapB
MPKQLNIRSDEAYERAHRLARAKGVSVTRVVEEALEKLDPDEDEEAFVASLTPEQRARYDRLKPIIDEIARTKLPGATSDHSDMYDEFGLPK